MSPDGICIGNELENTARPPHTQQLVLLTRDELAFPVFDVVKQQLRSNKIDANGSARGNCRSQSILWQSEKNGVFLEKELESPQVKPRLNRSGL